MSRRARRTSPSIADVARPDASRSKRTSLALLPSSDWDSLGEMAYLSFDVGSQRRAMLHRVGDEQSRAVLEHDAHSERRVVLAKESKQLRGAAAGSRGRVAPV